MKRMCNLSFSRRAGRSRVPHVRSGIDPKLTGTVGPSYTITLKQGAAKVKTLKAGKYTFVITDKAAIHNFTIERERAARRSRRC